MPRITVVLGGQASPESIAGPPVGVSILITTTRTKFGLAVEETPAGGRAPTSDRGLRPLGPATTTSVT